MSTKSPACEGRAFSWLAFDKSAVLCYNTHIDKKESKYEESYSSIYRPKLLTAVGEVRLGFSLLGSYKCLNMIFGDGKPVALAASL